MIVVDTSALMAIVLREPEGERCTGRLSDEKVLMSAATLTEALVVARGRALEADVLELLGTLDLTIVPLTADRARSAAEAYARFGKGVHPAKLNICDVFAYALAVEHGCPLLYVGDDFARTDVLAA
jgi:ribonuclease VapC